MELTKEYVESISFDIAKQKYYNAHKVDDKLNELKPMILELIDENERLRNELASLDTAVTDARAQAQREAESVKAEAQEFSDKAKAYAEQIIAEAQREADGLIVKAKTKAAAISPVKEDGTIGGSLSVHQLDEIDRINKQLEELDRAHSMQIMKLRKAIIEMATDM